MKNQRYAFADHYKNTEAFKKLFFWNFQENFQNDTEVTSEWMEQAQALFLVDVKNCFIHREWGGCAPN